MVLIDLVRTSCLERKQDDGQDHIPKLNSVPLCPNISPREVVLVAQALKWIDAAAVLLLKYFHFDNIVEEN